MVTYQIYKKQAWFNCLIEFLCIIFMINICLISDYFNTMVIELQFYSYKLAPVDTVFEKLYRTLYDEQKIPRKTLSDVVRC